MEAKQPNFNEFSQSNISPSKVPEDNFWDCSVCTYRNNPEAFKCLMCDVRKGTSTRKPKINPHLVAQYSPTLPKQPRREGHSKDGVKEKKKNSVGKKLGKRTWHCPRLKNVDRSTGQTREVTVNNVTVLITEYKAKVKKQSDSSDQSSSASSENGSQSEWSTDSRSGTVGID